MCSCGKEIVYSNRRSATLKPKDLVRQQRIINKVNPTAFIRYDEKSNRLYDVINSCKI